MTIIYVRIKFLVRLILQCFSFVRSGGKREENIPVFFEIVTSVIAHVSVEDSRSCRNSITHFPPPQTLFLYPIKMKKVVLLILIYGLS